MPTQYLSDLFGFDSQVVVVIGGTGVLGGALAEGVARAGAQVIVAGRSQERGEERVSAITGHGGQASFQRVDVEKRASIAELLESVLQLAGRVDGLINCAGVNSATPYFEIEVEDWRRVVQTNLESTHWACQIFGKHMVDAGGGSIVNVGSVSSSLPLSRVYAYSASKAAVLSLTQNVARELAPHHVRVNCLCPGFFPAEQNRKILDPDRVQRIMQHTPMHRFGEPDELVGATLLLLSPRAGSFITGAALYVDGGFTSMTL